MELSKELEDRLLDAPLCSPAIYDLVSNAISDTENCDDDDKDAVLLIFLSDEAALITEDLALLRTIIAEWEGRS